MSNVSHKEIGRKLARGEPLARASNVLLIPTREGSAVVSRGEYVIMERVGDGIVEYAWYHVGGSTSRQMTEVRRGIADVGSCEITRSSRQKTFEELVNELRQQ